MVEVPASRMMKLALPLLILTMLGFALVYLIVWRQGRIYARRDVEERVGSRVLGDLTGRVADAPAIALALGKGRVAGTSALLVPATDGLSERASAVGEAVALGGRALGPDGHPHSCRRRAGSTYLVDLQLQAGMRPPTGPRMPH